MIEGAKSANPALQALFDEALSLHPQTMDLSLVRIERLLARLGDPQTQLPPVFHVAGTNGKGSTVAFLRACLEASGRRVHVYTSPHLVSFNERIRLAGKLIDDTLLIETLRDVLSRNAGEPVTFFEVTTAVALLAFSRVPADAVILEVGLGGRLDATNVIVKPLVTGISQLSIDHQQWLGDTIIEIAGEKAAIAKPYVPLVLARYPATVTARIGSVAGPIGAPMIVRGIDWDAAVYEGQLHYRDSSLKLALPLPRLQGSHQIDNAGLAIAMLRHQDKLPMPDAAFRAGMGWAEWPARLQKLEAGPLNALLPVGSELWLDGGHNPAAARAIVDAFRAQNLAERPFHLVIGMLDTKDSAGFLKPFAERATSLYAVPITGHAHHAPAVLTAQADAIGLPATATADVADALTRIARGADRAKPPVVLIAGSLYLAGEVLAANGFTPS